MTEKDTAKIIDELIEEEVNVEEVNLEETVEEELNVEEIVSEFDRETVEEKATMMEEVSSEEERSREFSNDEESTVNEVLPKTKFKKKNPVLVPNVICAGFWRRFWAYLIDLFLGFTIVNIILGLSFGLTNIALPYMLEMPISLTIIALYFTLTTYFNKGQTLGKMILSLRVVEVDGSAPRLSTVIVREFFLRYVHLFSSLYILYVVTAFNRYKLNLLDIMADTVVIDQQKEEIYQLGQMRI